MSQIHDALGQDPDAPPETDPDEPEPDPEPEPSPNPHSQDEDDEEDEYHPRLPQNQGTEKLSGASQPTVGAHQVTCCHPVDLFQQQKVDTRKQEVADPPCRKPKEKPREQPKRRRTPTI